MRGLLFLLSALFLLESAKGIEYEELDENDRKIVDQAIDQGNKDHGKGKHLDFYTITNKNANMLNVILRPTLCASATPSVHRKECKTENDKPQVSCIDCKGTMEPCLLLKQKDEIKKRIEKCLWPVETHQYRAGQSHIMSQKGGNGQKSGCLGCI